MAHAQHSPAEVSFPHAIISANSTEKRPLLAGKVHIGGTIVIVSASIIQTTKSELLSSIFH